MKSGHKTSIIVGLILLLLVQLSLAVRVDCDGDDVGYDGAVWNVTAGNGYYYTDSDCKGDWMKAGGVIYNDGGTIYFQNNTPGARVEYNTGTYTPNNVSCNGQGVISCCVIKDGSGITVFDICQNVSQTSNGGVQVDRWVEMVNVDAPYENYTFREENRGYMNTSQLFYIPTKGWINSSSWHDWEYPFDEIFMPAMIMVNISYPVYVVMGTNATHAFGRYASSSQWDFGTLQANKTRARLPRFEQSFYYYIDDLILDSNNTKNDLNELDLGKYVEWMSADWLPKNYTFTDGMTSWSHWCYDTDSSCQNLYLRAGEIGYVPDIAKFKNVWEVPNTYMYTTESPESWGWDTIQFGGIELPGIFTKWQSQYSDYSILIQKSDGTYRNSSTWHNIKANLGYENATEFFYNYIINRTDLVFVPNITMHESWDNITIRIQDNITRSGRLAAQLYGHGNITFGSVRTREFSVTPGDQLNCSCYTNITTAGSRGYLAVCYLRLWNETAQGWIGKNYTSVSATSSHDWTNTQSSYLIPTTSTDITKGIYYLTELEKTDAEVYLDDCTIWRDGENITANYGFEEAYSSRENYTRSMYYDNWIDTREDYSPQAQTSLNYRPYTGNLDFLIKMYDRGFIQSANPWIPLIHEYKWLSFTTMESLVKGYNANYSEGYAAEQLRYATMKPSLRHTQYMTNPPVYEFFTEIYDNDPLEIDYDRVAGTLLGMAKVHNGTINFDWDDSDNGNGNINASYIIARYHKNMEESPSIYSSCLWVNDSDGMIPLGHTLQVNITRVPCTISTNADYYKLDSGSVQTVSGGMITLNGMSADSMHDLKVWDTPFRVTSKSGINFLYSFKDGNDVHSQVISTLAYPYGHGGGSASISYDGDFVILDSNTGDQLCTASPCGFSIGSTRNITAKYYKSSTAIRVAEAEEKLCKQSLSAFELVAVALLALVAVSIILFLMGGQVDWINVLITVLVVGVFLMISVKIISSVVGSSC